MKGRKRIKRTTLLVIGAILLWGVVAIWNEVQRSEAGLAAPHSTTASKEIPTPASNHTAIYQDPNQANIGTP
ncbi:hypothetical protein [Paenibacillus sp. SI8]|uniref:hypothetical protein n=1 Tax=unclassified Paenibacillus TaxID=185978 RepID=UPI0034655883